MILTIIVSLTIFYSVYKYYTVDEGGEQIEDNRRYHKL